MLKASCNQENITDFIGATYSPLSKKRRWSFLSLWYICSLRKQLTFGDATTGFPAKWRLRNERRNSILMTRHYSDLGSASHWLNPISNAARPIRSTTQIWVVCHQYGISTLVSQTSFGGETSGSVANCWLFSQANTSVGIQCSLQALSTHSYEKQNGDSSPFKNQTKKQEKCKTLKK